MTCTPSERVSEVDENENVSRSTNSSRKAVLLVRLLRASASYHRPVLGFNDGFARAGAEARASLGRQVDLRLGYDYYRTANEGKLTLNVYY
jgi:hypothetical protein